MSSDIDLARQAAIQYQQQKAQMEETTPDAILQGLMIDDADLKLMLKGEIQEPLNRVRELIVEFSALEKMDNEHARRIIELLNTLDSRLARYQRLKPFLMLLSPLVGLTNFSEKEAVMWKRRVSIMIRRQILDMDEEELEIDDVNFWESLKMLIWIKITDSVMGWKPRIVTEQKKIIQTEFPQPKKKGFFGRFF